MDNANAINVHGKVIKLEVVSNDNDFSGFEHDQDVEGNAVTFKIEPSKIGGIRSVKNEVIDQKEHTENGENENSDKTLINQSFFDKQQKIHKEKKAYICDLCGKSSSTTSNLNTHRKIHSTNKTFRIFR